MSCWHLLLPQAQIVSFSLAFVRHWSFVPHSKSMLLCETPFLPVNLLCLAAYYADWLSVNCGLKGRILKNLLFFAENRRFKRRKKEKNHSLLLRNLRFAKIRHIGNYFAYYACKNKGRFTYLQFAFCILIRLKSCQVFELGFLFLLQPKEKVQFR